jgi:hypothetical protein
MQREPATATTLVDDERVRVTRFDFAPGQETGWHVHGHDYVVTPVTECVMLLRSRAVARVKSRWRRARPIAARSVSSTM